MQENITTKKKKSSYTVFYIIGALILLYLIRNGVFTDKKEANKKAQEMVKVDTLTRLQLLNKMKANIDSTCPEMIDNITELENTSVLGNDTFQYNYVLKIDRTKYNVNILKKELGEKVLRDWVNTQKFDEFRKRNIAVVFSYQDMNKYFWFKDIFAPSNNYKPQ